MAGNPDRVHPLAPALAWLARSLSGVRVRWVGCHPSDRQRIYFANHTSHLDAAVLWAALPPLARARARPVAARDYWERGRIRRFVAERVFRAVLIDRRPPPDGRSRDPRAVIDRLLAAMGQDRSLIVFPEGTRGEGEEVSSFKSGLYYLALGAPKAELIPCYLENLNRILPKGEVLPVPLLSSLAFGPPVALAPGERKREFLDRAREAILRLRAS